MLDRTKPTLNLDHQLHSILCRHKAGWFTAERAMEDMGRAATIRDIVTGQVEDVAAIICWNAVEHVCEDVTSDIAIEIANGLDAGEPISPELHDFIETHAGIDYARALRKFDRSFAAA